MMSYAYCRIELIEPEAFAQLHMLRSLKATVHCKAFNTAGEYM